MSIKNIAKIFAHEHKIELGERRKSLIGRSGRLVLGYWNNGLRETIFVNKSFPPLDGVHESKIIIDNNGQPTLKMKILYGCLEDYITQLDKVESYLCGLVQDILIDSYSGLEAPETVLEQQLPIGIPDHEPDLQELLRSFYPSG